MSPEHHRYVYVQSAIGGAIANIVLNGGLGWLVTRGMATVPMTAIVGGVLSDMCGTAFGVAFGTTLGAVLQVKGDLKRRKITVPEFPPALQERLDRLPRSLWKRAFIVGLIAGALFAPPVLLGLWLTGLPELPRWTYIGVKSALAAVEAALVTPFLVLAALDDVRRSPPSAVGGRSEI